MPFLERSFPSTFCKTTLTECRRSIESSTSMNLIGLSSVGISFFLRFLSTHLDYKFIHINTFELPEFTKDEFFKQFAHKTTSNHLSENSLAQTRTGLEQLAKENDRVVIIINRIDRLSKLLDQSFFDNLRYLREANRKKIIFFFVSATPLIELRTDTIRDTSSMHIRQVFFKPYTKEDLLAITKVDGTPLIKPKALELSGGHHSLFQTLLRCQSLDNPLSDPMVELVIKDIFLSQNAKRREQLQALAQNKKATDLDFLLNIGLIKKAGKSYQFFSDLLAKYLEHSSSIALPMKEKRLLKLLLRNSGRVVKKQDIFDHIWGDEVVGDWALNSLIYRLRHHSAFDNSRYTIKSVKKDGYILVDSNK